MTKTVKTTYTTVAIPKSMALKLAKLVGHEGYRSVAEVVMNCIRSQMYKIDAQLEKIEKEDLLDDIKKG